MPGLAVLAQGVFTHLRKSHGLLEAQYPPLLTSGRRPAVRADSGLPPNPVPAWVGCRSSVWLLLALLRSISFSVGCELEVRLQNSFTPLGLVAEDSQDHGPSCRWRGTPLCSCFGSNCRPRRSSVLFPLPGTWGQGQAPRVLGAVRVELPRPPVSAGGAVHLPVFTVAVPASTLSTPSAWSSVPRPPT